MKIHCYECGKEFKAATGFFIERRIINPDVVPAETVITGYGYCSAECAAKNHVLAEDIELQDVSNFDTPDANEILIPDEGGERIPVRRVSDERKDKRKRWLRQALKVEGT